MRRERSGKTIPEVRNCLRGGRWISVSKASRELGTETGTPSRCDRGGRRVETWYPVVLEDTFN